MACPKSSGPRLIAEELLPLGGVAGLAVNMGACVWRNGRSFAWKLGRGSVRRLGVLAALPARTWRCRRASLKKSKHALLSASLVLRGGLAETAPLQLSSPWGPADVQLLFLPQIVRACSPTRAIEGSRPP